jgi:hypothetical protein
MFLLLAELLHKLLDFQALLGVVAPGVMHRALRTAVVTARCLMGTLVTTRATAPTCRCSYSNGCPSERLILDASLLLLIPE